MVSANDIRNGARFNPELYQRYVEQENRTGYSMHVSMRSLPAIVAGEGELRDQENPDCFF